MTTATPHAGTAADPGIVAVPTTATTTDAAALSVAAADARVAADAAAARSGVSVVHVESLEMLGEVLRVVDRIWEPDPDDRPITLAILRAMVHSGSYCAAAFDGTDMVGLCIGFLADLPRRSLHSHIAGVTSAGHGRHIGFALKLDQRAWALERGLDTVTWTFDPLVRRNAFFNTVKLGAVPTGYLVDFYGDMSDLINLGQGSDRLLTQWTLLDPGVVAAAGGAVVEPDVPGAVAEGATIVLDDTGHGPSAIAPATSRVALVRVPPDIEGLRGIDPALGIGWRRAVRDSLGALMGEGWTVEGVSRSGWFVLHAPGATS